MKDENGNGVMKPFWEMTEEDQKACLDATEWCCADSDISVEAVSPPVI